MSSPMSSPETFPLREIYLESLSYPLRTNKPKYWALLKPNASGKFLLHLDPIPDDAYSITIRYEPVPDELDDDTDVPQYLPEEYHYLIAYGTIAILASHQNDWDQAQHWESRFRAGVNEMIRKYGLVPPKNFPNIKLMAGGA